MKFRGSSILLQGSMVNFVVSIILGSYSVIGYAAAIFGFCISDTQRTSTLAAGSLCGCIAVISYLSGRSLVESAKRLKSYQDKLFGAETYGVYGIFLANICYVLAAIGFVVVLIDNTPLTYSLSDTLLILSGLSLGLAAFLSAVCSLLLHE